MCGVDTLALQPPEIERTRARIAGCTNGCISYGPNRGHKTYGLPAQVAPACDRLLVETAVELLRELFPERPAPAAGDRLASGRLPAPPPVAPLRRPADPPPPGQGA